MLRDRKSKLSWYGLAVVLVDKPADTYEIIVTPMEEMNLLDGDLNKWEVKYDIALPDINGNTKSSGVKLDAKLKATWLPFSTSGNKKSAPDVVKNETVLLYRYADEDKYYWDVIFYEPKIRRLEHCVYTWGNKTAPLVEYDESSSYWFKVSTRDKYIWLHTSKDDKGSEAATYDIKIDTKLGEVTLVDNHQNWIKLFSTQRKIDIKTKTFNVDVSQMNVSGNVHIGGHLKVKGTIGTGSGILSPSCCCTCRDTPSFPGNDFAQTAEMIFK